MSAPLVFYHGPAEVAFYSTAVVWFGFEAVMSLRQRWRAAVPPRQDPTAFVVVACIAGAIFAAERLGRDGPLIWPGGRAWPVIAGIPLIIAGIGLRAWSISALGRFFQYQIQIQVGHTVVTSGPYRYVRHPSYTGMAIGLTGFALASGDVLSLPAVAILGGAGLAIRIRAEERQLHEALGEEYGCFTASRKRLVPGLW